MARVTAPFLSIDAQGQIAKTLVASTWRGVKYQRRYVVPSNPKTEGQQHTRGVFGWLNGVWKLMNAAAQAPWIAYAKGKPLTDRNALQKFNVAPLRGDGDDYAADATGFVASPGVAGGLAIAGIAHASGGAGELTVTVTAPDLPAGWTITNVHCLAFLDKSVWNSEDYVTYYASDNADPYAPAFADLPTGTYDAFAWIEYAKPDGSVAYSPSLGVQQAVA